MKEVIRKSAKRGESIRRSSNLIHSWLKPEDYVGMAEAVHEYGESPNVYIQGK